MWLGLANDSSYWNRIGADRSFLETYLRNLRNRSALVAAELLPIAARYDSFAGWYIPTEIDDVNWRTREAAGSLNRFVSGLSRDLRRITPDAGIAISGFSNAYLDPRGFERFWTKLMTEAKLDIVLFQDGVGAGKLLPRELGFYIQAIQRSSKQSGCRLVVVLELFEQIPGDSGFDARPAPFERIIDQLNQVRQTGVTEIFAFSVPEYLTPLGGPEAEKNYRDYRRLLSPRGPRE